MDVRCSLLTTVAKGAHANTIEPYQLQTPKRAHHVSEKSKKTWCVVRMRFKSAKSRLGSLHILKRQLVQISEFYHTID